MVPDALRLVARTDHGATGDQAMARIVAGEIKLAMGVGHRLPAGNHGFSRGFR
jgi:hypothetical protein